MTTLKERIAGIVDKNLREAGAIYEHNTEETTKEILSVIREDVAGLIDIMEGLLVDFQLGCTIEPYGLDFGKKQCESKVDKIKQELNRLEELK